MGEINTIGQIDFNLVDEQFELSYYHPVTDDIIRDKVPVSKIADKIIDSLYPNELEEAIKLSKEEFSKLNNRKKAILFIRYVGEVQYSDYDLYFGDAVKGYISEVNE